MSIYIFKTSVEFKNLDRVNAILHSLNIEATWSFDLEDCDNILRLDSRTNQVKRICVELEKAGFQCTELN